MAQLTVNPYPILGEQLSDGLDYIIAHISGPATIDNLVDQVSDYIETLDYLTTPFSTSTKMQVKSVAYTAINSYINGRCKSNYNGVERSFVNQLTGRSLVDGTVDTLSARITDIEEEIPKCGLSIESQGHLFMATITGKTTNEYFLSEIAAGGASSWNPYLSSALVSGIANLPFWVSASMEGALLGARTTFKGMISPTTNIVTTEIVSALISALTITSGKIIFLWITKILPGEYNSVQIGISESPMLRGAQKTFHTSNSQMGHQVLEPVPDSSLKSNRLMKQGPALDQREINNSITSEQINSGGVFFYGNCGGPYNYGWTYAGGCRCGVSIPGPWGPKTLCSDGNVDLIKINGNDATICNCGVFHSVGYTGT